MRVALIYPHQLFDEHPAARNADACVLVEEPLYFTQYRFHAKKLILHRAAMQNYAAKLRAAGYAIHYASMDELGSTGEIVEVLTRIGATSVVVVDVCDDWLDQRLCAALRAANIELSVIDDPSFLTSDEVFAQQASGRKAHYFTDFYIRQRKRLSLLLDDRGQPLGGKWSFDAENRNKLPRDVVIPKVTWPDADDAVAEATQYVAKHFPNAIGSADDFHYPVTHAAARAALNDFLEHRFVHFGSYEDAVHREEPFLFHSVITPALNCGLLSPSEVLARALEFSDRVPLNSLEGFVRQVIGWREYTRCAYRSSGRRQRSQNFWEHHHPMPRAFYDGTTGIEPVDTVIQRVLKHAYCHHIERLMILGNFMLLCEINPNAVYQWFMELFIDAYDWVMVPNVYGMSQFADGGTITTKPYISGSNYICRMSNFRKGEWCQIWDALYWCFIDRHRDKLNQIPRMAVIVRQCERLGDRLLEHRRIAEKFLDKLHGARH